MVKNTVISYQSLCIGNVTPCQSNGGTRATSYASRTKQCNQSYAKSAVKPGKPWLTSSNDETAVVKMAVKNACDAAGGKPQLIILGECCYSGALSGFTFTPDCCGGGEQRCFSVGVLAGYNGKTAQVRPANVEGCIHMHVNGLSVFFVHIPNNLAKGKSLRTYIRDVKGRANGKKYSHSSGGAKTAGYVIMGDTNEGKSGQICAGSGIGGSTINFTQGGAHPTGGGANAYHDTVISNLNFVDHRSAESKKPTAVLKAKVPGRALITSLAYVPRAAPSHTYTDHLGVKIRLTVP